MAALFWFSFSEIIQKSLIHIFLKHAAY